MDQNDPDYAQKLKDLLSKAADLTTNEGNEKPAPLEGYGALAQNQPADPGKLAGVTPTGSPIDLAAGAAGAKLGSAMAQDAGSILGNQIGSIGSDVSQSPGIIQKFQNTLGKGNMSTQDMIANAQNIAKRAAQTGKVNPITTDLMQALQERAGRELAKNQTTASMLAEAKQKALASIAGQ